MEQLVPVHVEDFREGTAGPTVSVPESVKEVFQLIYTDVIVDHIVKESNRYALLGMGQSTFDKWEKVNRHLCLHWHNSHDGSRGSSQSS